MTFAKVSSSSIGMESRRVSSLRTKADGTEDIYGLKHLNAFFEGLKASTITTPLLKDFIKKRLSEGASPSTVNRNLGLLRRMIYQAHREDSSVHVPHFPMLDEPEARQGFLQDDAFVKLLAELPDYLKTFTLLLYTTGVRTGEAKKILWEHVDLDAHEIHLPGSITKNGEPRILPLVGALVHRMKVERKDSGRVFPIGVFHKAWWSACVRAGLGTRTPGRKTADGEPAKDSSRMTFDARTSQHASPGNQHDGCEENIRASDGRSF